MKSIRGSVLIHVIVALAVISGIVFALLARAVSSQGIVVARRAQNEALLLEDSARAAVRAALTDAAKTGDYTTIGAKVTSVLQEMKRAEWNDVSFTGNLAVTNLFAKSEVPVGGVYGSPFDGSSLIGQRIEHALTAQITLGTTLNESDAISRPTPVAVEVLEVPSVEFQLLATEDEFVAETGSTALSIDGKALLNGGLKRSFSGGLTVAADGAVIVPVPTGDRYADLNTPVGALPRASWGLLDTAHLAADPTEVAPANKTAVFAIQNYPSYITTLASGRSITWNDPLIAPASMPMGVGFQMFNGSMRVVVNLSTYVAEEGIYVQCSDATKDIGVVVVGSNSATAALPIVATNGRVTLYGNNERPVLVSSSYTAGVTLVSSAFAGTAGSAASDTVWRGYLVVPAKNLNLDTAEVWTNKTYTISGTLLFKGGTIKGIPSLAIKSDSSLKAALESSTMNSDRFALTFAHLSQP